MKQRTNAIWLSYFGSEDFDNARAVLVRAMQAAFPNDEVIEQLDESRDAR